MPRTTKLALFLYMTLSTRAAAQSPALTPDQQLARDIFAELIGINTTHEHGSTTPAAQAVARRLLLSSDSLSATLQCTGRAVPEISRRRVGDFPLDSTLGFLERRYPCFSPEPWTDEDSLLNSAETHVDFRDFAGIRFEVNCLTVIHCLVLEGTQLHDSLDPTAPVSRWTVTATNAILPRGVPYPATWQQVLDAYGPRYYADRAGRVEFCSLPSFGFYFERYRAGQPIGAVVEPPPPRALVAGVRITPFDSVPAAACR